MNHWSGTSNIGGEPLSGVSDGEGAVLSETLTFATNNTFGKLHPETTGAWQCVRCGLWFDSQPSFYIGGVGPLCTDCRVAL
jgi:hypothetical protein